jgi:hypothetical protein
MKHTARIQITFLLALSLIALAISLAVPGCVDDTDMLPRRGSSVSAPANSGRGRGPGWKNHENGNPQVGPGPKNPDGKPRQ